MLKYLHSKVTNNLMPDLTLVIDIDFDIGIKRSLKKKKEETRFEFKDNLFHKKVSLGFKNLKKKKKIKVINGNYSKNEIHKNIVDFLNKKKYLTNKFLIIMNIDSNIIENKYKQEFDFISKLYLKEIFPHAWIFYGPKESGKRSSLIFLLKGFEGKK